MAQFLALEWDATQLAAVEADASKSNVRIRNTAQLQWPEDLDPDTQAEAAGQWLKKQLHEAGISAKQVLLTLPREDTVVRQLELPNAPEEELPDLVRFQAQTKSTVSLDQYLLDYVPMPAREGYDGLDVLMVSIPIERAEYLRSVLSVAGLELVSIGINPLATAEIAVREDRKRRHDPAELSLLVVQHGERVEISMMREQRILFSHSTQVQGNDVQDARDVVSQISRSRFSQQRLLEGFDFSRVWIFGSTGRNQNLSEAITAELNCPVNVVDPLVSAGTSGGQLDDAAFHGLFAGPIGVLHAHVDSIVPAVNFLAPRKRVEKPDTRRLKILAGVGAAVVVIAGIYSINQWQLSTMDEDIELTRGQYTQLQKENKAGEEKLAAANVISYWFKTTPHWTMELASFNNIVREVNEPAPNSMTRATHRFYLTELQANTTTTDVLTHVSGRGFAQTGTDVDQIRETLIRENYRVHPSEVKWSKDDPPYLREYPFDVDAGKKPERPQKSRVRRGRTR